MTNAPTIWDDPDTNAALEAVVRVPPRVLMQSMCVLITQYVTDLALEVAEDSDPNNDDLDPSIAERMSTHGIVAYLRELLELDDAMCDQVRAFLDDAHVQQFTHFPPEFVHALSTRV